MTPSPLLLLPKGASHKFTRFHYTSLCQTFLHEQASLRQPHKPPYGPCFFVLVPKRRPYDSPMFSVKNPFKGENCMGTYPQREAFWVLLDTKQKPPFKPTLSSGLDRDFMSFLLKPSYGFSAYITPSQQESAICFSRPIYLEQFQAP